MLKLCVPCSKRNAAELKRLNLVSKNPVTEKFKTSYGVYTLSKKGDTWWLANSKSGKFPYKTREAALKALPR